VADHVYVHAVFYADSDSTGDSGYDDLIFLQQNISCLGSLNDSLLQLVVGSNVVSSHPSDVIQVILKLSVVEIGRDHVPTIVEAASDHQNADQSLQLFHAAKPPGPLATDQLFEMVSNGGDVSILQRSCRAGNHLDFPFGNLLANIDPVRYSH